MEWQYCNEASSVIQSYVRCSLHNIQQAPINVAAGRSDKAFSQDADSDVRYAILTPGYELEGCQTVIYSALGQ